MFNVEGRSYPVEVRYRPLTDEVVSSSDDDAFDDVEDNLPRAVINAVEECFDDAHKKGHPNQADILVFCATEAEIRDLQEVLEGEITRSPSLRHTQVLPLFARQTYGEQQRIFQPSGGGRRIIISTNVAETALTVPNIRYVIDLGFARISRYSYRSRVQRLPIEAISQAAANQRKGRCGRIASGVCIRLYSEEDFNSRPEFTEPEILRTNLASVMLQMASLRLGTVEQFDFIEPPDSRLVKDGTKLLEELGAIATTTKTQLKKRFEQSKQSKNSVKSNEKNNAKDHVQLTPVGKKMARMPIDPRLSRMLIAGSEFDCLQDMLIIVSALAVQDPRERPHEKRTQADQKHAIFRQENSDFLFYISLWNALFNEDENGNKLTNSQRKAFAKKHFLSFPRIREWQKTYQQLVQMVDDLRLTGLDTDKETDSNKDVNNKQKVGREKGLEKGKGVEKGAEKERKRLSLKGNKSAKNSHKHSQFNQQSSHLNQQQARKSLLDEEQRQAVKYANLHRALLTGLLSFIAHKSIDAKSRGEYTATRQQKTKIFPASTVFKTAPNWVMAFEVVETSQVFMRCVAKIEPEWIIASAGELLKYHYYEPHWSKKTGRVRAYAQISLFGLIIVGKQICSYEQVNLAESREIFIRDGLVTGELGYANGNSLKNNSLNNNKPQSKSNIAFYKQQAKKSASKQPPFLQHNLDKIADVELIEEKLRRRDLLVDEEALYQFYDSKIPPHIASRKAFEDWRAEVEKTDKNYLFFSDEDVLKQSAPTTGDFPESWRLGSLKLPLSYTFDPASEDDGVTIRVPLPALPQLNPVELLWGIAGWRFELVTQLLKTLPKDIRRQIVPIPDTAKSIYDELEKNHQQGLLNQLCQALTRRGVRGATSAVTPDDFDPSKVDHYLQPQICVVDDKKRIIEKGRNLTSLQSRHAIKTSQAVHEHAGLHREFPEHFRFSKNRHSAGIVMKEFSALVSDGKSGNDSNNNAKNNNTNNKGKTKGKQSVQQMQKGQLGEAVSIHQFTDIVSALNAHRVGVLTLIKGKLGAKRKQLTSQIDNSFKLAFAPLGQLDKLKTIVIDATLDATLCQHHIDFDHSSHLPERLDGVEGERSKKLASQLPFTLEEYQQTEQAVLANFLSVGQEMIRLLKQVYTRWQRVRQSVQMLNTEVFGESIDDIEDQLSDLHLADFVYRMDYQRWTQYPRYLEALEIRIERLEHNLEGDLDAVYELDVHMERIAERADDPKIAEYRWLIEEFRIQLFAQPMKTRCSVSQKRLEKVWGKVNV
ncbi:MAG: ATP-dependent helicase [Pseudomonadales bacterium]|nr:MAG: ATP-dependent helicase [Pseudomonadales bacterium]